MLRNLEVMKLMSHLIITLVITVGYVILVYLKGYSDETLKAAVTLALGYWFGAVRFGSGSNSNDSSNSGDSTNKDEPKK